MKAGDLGSPETRSTVGELTTPSLHRQLPALGHCLTICKPPDTID